MDFIERFFHISPDNGSGVTEGCLFSLAALVSLAIVHRHFVREVWRAVVQHCSTEPRVEGAVKKLATDAGGR
jgi:hypothetical protein